MRTDASAAFAAAINQTHRLTAELMVLTAAGETPIDFVGGSVSLNTSADSRGRLDITVPVSLRPESPIDLLAPYGNEIRVRLGIHFPDDSIELLPLGIYRIHGVDDEDSGSEASVTLSALDRSAIIIEAVFETAFHQAAGVPIHEAIEALILEAYPGCEMRFTETALTTPELVAAANADRWDFCQGLAEAMLCSLYFDAEGVLVLAPAPTGLSPAVHTISEGPGGALIRRSRSWSREGAVNRVRVTGEATSETGDPPEGVAIDDNPFSPTRYGGPFGKVTFEWASEYVTTDDQAAGSAQLLLSQKLGTTRTVSFDSLVDPRLEPGDVVDIVRDGSTESHLIDSISIPLTVEGSMSATTRAVQVLNP